MERKAKDSIHDYVGIVKSILEVLLGMSNLGNRQIQALFSEPLVEFVAALLRIIQRWLIPKVRKMPRR